MILCFFSNCSISIDHLSEADLGSWTCRVHHSASRQFQEAHIQVKRPKEDVYVRLPTNIKPSRYEAFLIPFIIPDNFTIAGEVNIDINITEPTTNITVHIYDMTIHEAESRLVLAEDDSEVAITGRVVTNSKFNQISNIVLFGHYY